MNLKEKTLIQKILNYVAFSVSMILSPYLTAAVFIVIVVYKYSANFTEFLPWLLIFFVFAIVIPGSYIFWLFETKKIGDIHIANQKDRRVPFIVMAVSSLVGTIILSIFGAVKQIIIIGAVYTANAIVVASITQVWKISVHMAMFASIATISVILFGNQCAWLYLLLIPLAWSRIYRKRHTPWQATAGAILASIMTAVIFKIFGY